MNDTMTTSWSDDGIGLVKTSEKVASNICAGYDEVMDESAKKGCKFCGSLNWQEQKPSRLPDDKNLPATGWKRIRR